MKRSEFRRAPEAVRAWQQRSRRRLRSKSPRTGGNPIPAASRRAVEGRSGGLCEAKLDGCTWWADHVHHVIPRRARRHEPDVLLNVCWHCHSEIHRWPQLSYAFGFLRRSSTT